MTVPLNQTAGNANAFGPYRLGETLGRGGMGEVYRAFDTEHERTVAVKRLAPNLATDPEFQVRFRREARIAARLRSPHVIPIHRYGEIDGQLYIEMRFADGGDLDNLIRATGGLALDRAVDILEQVANAVDDAHAHGLIHRDIKPSNILLDNGMRDFCYLADFGITRAAEAGTSLTRAGAQPGSLAYMAPEQFDGALTRRSDVYSLTCVFFEMITGDRPFAGEGLAALVNAHLKIPPPRPSDRHPGAGIFDELVAIGMAKDARGRYESAGDLARAARRVLETHRATSTTPPAGQTGSGSVGPQIDDARAAAVPAVNATQPGHVGADAVHPPRPATAEAITVDFDLLRLTRPPRPMKPLRPRLLLLGVVLSVLALITTVWASTARGDMDQDPAPPLDGPTTPPSAPVGPVLTEAVFVGRSSDNALTVAVGIKDGRAAGYLCDGHSVEAWLEGSLTGDQLVLHGRDPGTAVTAAVDQRSLLGEITIGGTVSPFSAEIATGPAGLYQSRRTVDGIATRIGWIVLPDGTQVGVRKHDNQRTPAPPLNPTTLSAVDDGRVIPAERLSGASAVLGF